MSTTAPITTTTKRGRGRPIAANEAQQAEVLRLREAGETLRGIARRTGLGMMTVVTITSKRKNMNKPPSQVPDLIEAAAEGQGEDKQSAARPRTFVVTFFTDEHAYQKFERELTLAQMVELVRDTRGRTKEELPMRVIAKEEVA